MSDVSKSSSKPAFVVRGGARADGSRFHERRIRDLLFVCALLSVLTTVGIILVLLNDSVFSLGKGTAFFQRVSLTQFLFDTEWYPDDPEPRYGIWPLVCGTLMVSGIACAIGIPMGLGSAVYLSEYARPRERAVLKPVLELLAGVPTVVYGYFGLVFVTPYVLRPVFRWLLNAEVDTYNVASAGIVVGFMITPMIASVSEDVLRAVPRSLRDAAYALGATQLDVSARVVVPAALSGILASILLAFARAIGETMAVAVAAGDLRSMSLNPFRSMQTMTAYIVSQSTGEDDAGGIIFKSIYAVALSLFVMTLTINVISQWIMRRYREVYH